MGYFSVLVTFAKEATHKKKKKNTHKKKNPQQQPTNQKKKGLQNYRRKKPNDWNSWDNHTAVFYVPAAVLFWNPILKAM